MDCLPCRIYSGFIREYLLGKLSTLYIEHIVFIIKINKKEKNEKCIVISLVSDGLQTAAVIGKILSLGWKEK